MMNSGNRAQARFLLLTGWKFPGKRYTPDMDLKPSNSDTSQTGNSGPSTGSESRQLLQKIHGLMLRDDPTEAIRECDRLNRESPDFAAGWAMSSQLALRLGDPGSALRAIDNSLALEPDQTEWLLQRARCLLALNRGIEARTIARALSQRSFNTASLSTAAGLLLSSLGMYEQAESLFLGSVKRAPGVAGHYYNLATVQRFMGKLQEAEANLDKAIEIDPDDAEALALRSGLRRQSSQSNHIDELKAALAGPDRSPKQLVSVCYALAKELEDTGDYSESFSYLRRGADLRRQHLRYEVQRDLETMASIREVYSREVFTEGRNGYVSASPIFVIGMPRTGTTLVERMLGSHPVVQAAGELNNFAVELVKLARELAGEQKPSGPELVHLSRNIDFASLGQAYLDSTKAFVSDKPHFVDKMPLNFLYAGLIHLALPKAKIIHLERNAMDTCYAVYKTLFENAYPYSYDLGELGRYFVAYSRLMDHWHDMMPGVIHRIHYEDLVTRYRSVVEATLEYCNLSWQEQCLHSHDSGGYSATASAAQVRAPVHSESVGRWKKYEKELQPLADIFRNAGIDY
jgi:tetratricopeptide (TPR) repeat protein